MSAPVLLNLLNELGGKIRCEAVPRILLICFNEFNKFNNIGARMQDSIYHMTLKSHLICDICIKTSRFRHKKMQRFNGRQRITLQVICLFNPQVDYRF